MHLLGWNLIMYINIYKVTDIYIKQNVNGLFIMGAH